MNKIFIVNPKGDLMQLGNNSILSYEKLNDNVNQVFPLVKGI